MSNANASFALEGDVDDVHAAVLVTPVVCGGAGAAAALAAVAAKRLCR